MASLSSAANGTAVIGLVDVVFKNGKDLYDLLYRSFKADPEAQSLLKEIHEFEDVVASLREFAIEFQTSTLVIRDGLTLNVYNILQSCRDDLTLLIRAAENAIKQQNSSWLGQFIRGVKWALNNKDVVEIRDRLGRHKADLMLALETCVGYV